jgi:hypothetical protein
MVVEISLNCQFIPCYFTTSITNTSILLQLIPINRQNNQLDESSYCISSYSENKAIYQYHILIHILDNVCIPSGPDLPLFVFLKPVKDYEL